MKSVEPEIDTLMMLWSALSLFMIVTGFVTLEPTFCEPKPPPLPPHGSAATADGTPATSVASERAGHEPRAASQQDSGEGHDQQQRRGR